MEVWEPSSSRLQVGDGRDVSFSQSMLMDVVVSGPSDLLSTPSASVPSVQASKPKKRGLEDDA